MKKKKLSTNPRAVWARKNYAEKKLNQGRQTAATLKKLVLNQSLQKHRRPSMSMGAAALALSKRLQGISREEMELLGFLIQLSSVVNKAFPKREAA